MSQAPQASAIDVGTVVADTYRVTRLIGRGGMGAVWAADHTRLPGKRVAIKVLHADVAMEPDAVARFRREAEITSRLGHPNIVGVLDFNTLPGGKHYLVLDFLEGESLDSRLERGPMHLEEVLEIVRQVGSALRAAHQAHVVHRDLKPQNVFLTRASPDSPDDVAKVLDFGISKIRGSQTVKTQDSTILGTPQYMAPEQAVGNHDAVNSTTDVFALGAMTYEMIAGRPAFVGQTIPEVVFKVVYEEPIPIAHLVPNLPANIANAIHRALSKQQDQRFPSMDALVEALTGQPLVTARRRGASLLPRTPNPVVNTSDQTNPVATAETIASGEHDSPLATADTMDSGRGAAPLPDPTAATLASGQHPPILAPPPTAGATVPAPPSGRRGAQAAPRRKSLISFFVVAALGGAGAAAFATWKLGMDQSQPAASTTGDTAAAGDTKVAAAPPDVRDDDSAVPQQPTPPEGIGDAPRESKGSEHDSASATAASDTAAKDTAAKDTASKDTAAKDTAAKDTAAKDTASKDTAAKDTAAKDTAAKNTAAKDTAAKDTAASSKHVRHRDAATANEAKPSPAANPDLDAARKALAGGDAGAAIRLARRALRDGAGPRAYAIMAQAYCSGSDLGNARASYSRLSGRAKKRIARICRRHGIELD